MQVFKTLYNINTRGIKRINQDISYFNESFIKDKKILNLKHKYDKFLILLKQNREIIRGKRNKLTIYEISKIVDLSKSHFYRIKKEVDTKGFTYWKELVRKSTKPHNNRQSEIPKEIQDFILEIRLNNPTYSKDKIKIILDRDYLLKPEYSHLKTISPSSINRILKELQNKSLITLKPSKQNHKYLKIESNVKPRNFINRHSQPWNFEEHFIGNGNINKRDKNNETKMNKLKQLKNKNKLVENKAKLGELIQIDHLKVRINNIQMYEFSAIDPFTRILISQLYPSPNSKNAKHFLLEKVIKQLPFPIKSIQVDGGSEFMLHFEEACKNNNIPLFVLPPYRPKYNGRVERSNRTIREDFYYKNKELEYCNKLGEINEKLQVFIDKYNNYRPHQSLDFKTPMEYYKYAMINRGENSHLI